MSYYKMFDKNCFNRIILLCIEGQKNSKIAPPNLKKFSFTCYGNILGKHGFLQAGKENSQNQKVLRILILG